jgi:hypothetical protein
VRRSLALAKPKSERVRNGLEVECLYFDEVSEQVTDIDVGHLTGQDARPARSKGTRNFCSILACPVQICLKNVR